MLTLVLPGLAILSKKDLQLSPSKIDSRSAAAFIQDVRLQNSIVALSIIRLLSGDFFDSVDP
jgi:hypothetical protein